MNKPRIFLGNVMHRRLRPAVNAFVYPVFYIQLPVRHPELANCPIFSVDRSNLLSFRTKDHGARDGSPLLPWIQAQLRQRGLPDDGEITLQCFPRVFGYVFNPVSFWFCRNIEGALIAVLAEVNNTFGGRHSYLLHNADGSPFRDGQEICASKEFHVSPFNEIEGGYRFRFHLDRPLPLARIDYDDAEGELLLTSISGKPRAWSTAALLGAFLKMPFLTAGVMFRIHWQAVKLWLKGVPFRGAHVSQPIGRIHSKRWDCVCRDGMDAKARGAGNGSSIPEPSNAGDRPPRQTRRARVWRGALLRCRSLVQITARHDRRLALHPRQTLAQPTAYCEHALKEPTK